MSSMPSATSTKGVTCSVAGAGKVTLIGSNCPASQVGWCVNCEGGRTAQIFSDCAITKYLSRATAHRPCGRQTIAAVEIVWRAVLTRALDFKEHRPPADRRPAGRLVSRHLQRWQFSVDRQNDGAPVLCTVACLLAVLTYGEALSDRIVWYRIAIFCVISYRIVSLMEPVSCHYYISLSANEYIVRCLANHSAMLLMFRISLSTNEYIVHCLANH